MRGFPLVHALGAAFVNHAPSSQSSAFSCFTPMRLRAPSTQSPPNPRRATTFKSLHLRPVKCSGVDHAGGGDDRGAVLVVVEYRDIHQLAQALLNDETIGRTDIFEVDAAEGRPEKLTQLTNSSTSGIHFDVDAIDIGETLEQDGLAFHHRFPASAPIRPGPAPPCRWKSPPRNCPWRYNHRRSGSFWISGRARHARRIAQRQVALRHQRLGGDDRDFAGLPRRVLVSESPSDRPSGSLTISSDLLPPSRFFFPVAPIGDIPLPCRHHPVSSRFHAQVPST